MPVASASGQGPVDSRVVGADPPSIAPISCVGPRAEVDYTSEAATANPRAAVVSPFPPFWPITDKDLQMTVLSLTYQYRAVV